MNNSVKLASVSPGDKGVAVIAKDGQYVKYSNGIVYDENIGLKWIAGPDKNMGGSAAGSWIKNCNVDGGRWKMPSGSELKGIYKKGKGSRNMTPLLKTSGWGVWSSGSTGFSFDRGNTNPHDGDGFVYFDRVFAVRSRK
jgi:hypothetical protein